MLHGTAKRTFPTIQFTEENSSRTETFRKFVFASGQPQGSRGSSMQTEILLLKVIHYIQTMTKLKCVGKSSCTLPCIFVKEKVLGLESSS